MTEAKLREMVVAEYEAQGFVVSGNSIKTELSARDLHGNNRSVPTLFDEDDDVDFGKIEPELRLCETPEMIKSFTDLSKEHWSTPHTPQVGRSMRYVVHDKGNNRPMGILGLSSPILSQKARDDFLGINKDNRQEWVNKGMNMFRCGAIPPYGKYFASRLTASMVLTAKVATDYFNRYGESVQWFTAMGAFGRTPIYDRHNYSGNKVSWFMGYSSGFGSFQVSPELLAAMRAFLKSRKINTEYKSGVKMKTINDAMRRLGFKDKDTSHGIKRGIYLLTGHTDLRALIAGGKSDRYFYPEDVLIRAWRKKAKAKLKELVE